MSMKKEFADKVKKAIDENGGYRPAAKKWGVSHQTLYNVVNKKVGADTLLLIQRHSGIDLMSPLSSNELY